MKVLTLTAIAKLISEHLHRFEADPVINAVRPRMDTRPYYHAGAVRTGNRIHVRYIAYQPGSSLTRERAEAYLAWLSAGNVGTHYAAEEAARAQAAR